MAKIVKEHSEYELDEYPKTCVECPFCRVYEQMDMGAIISYFCCRLGYTKDYKIHDRIKIVDRGEFKYKRWDGCKIEENPSVYLEER